MALMPVPSPGTLFRTFAADVHRFLRRRLPTDADADDVLQDVFARVVEHADRLRHAEKAQGWLYTIARRAVADFYRRRGRGPDTRHALPEALAADETASEAHEEVLSWLRPMIDALPAKYARPLRWADVDGLRQQEIADRLGLSLSGAKSRVQRARRKLGDVLAACCAVEFGPDGRVASFRRLRDTEPGGAAEPRVAEQRRGELGVCCNE